METSARTTGLAAIVPSQGNGKMGEAAKRDQDEWTDKLRTRAKELARDLEHGYMEMAKILYQVYDTPVDGSPKNLPLYSKWGFASFADYAEKELGLQAKKAGSLRRIWYRLEVELAGIPVELKDRIIRMGWTKVRELIRILTLRNADEWVGLAERSSYPELCVSINRYIDEVENAKKLAEEKGEDVEALNAELPQVEKLYPTTFAFYEGQKKNVELALARCAELSKSSVKSNNLDLICTEFLATNNFSHIDDLQKVRYLAKFEMLFGLKLVVVDPETNQVIYGIEALERLAKGAVE